jgi:transposase
MVAGRRGCAGVTRQPRRELAARDMEGLLRAIERWTVEASRAGRAVQRVVVTNEAGRDGFWIARYLIGRGLEVHVMLPASIPVPRHKRRAKTDRIDLDMLLRTLLAFLRGEPRVCSMVRIASEAEEDARRPGRERDALVRDRIAIENRSESLLSHQPDRAVRMIQIPAHLYGLGLETATYLVRELFCRPFRHRRAVAAFAG